MDRSFFSIANSSLHSLIALVPFHRDTSWTCSTSTPSSPNGRRPSRPWTRVSCRRWTKPPSRISLTRTQTSPTDRSTKTTNGGFLDFSFSLSLREGMGGRRVAILFFFLVSRFFLEGELGKKWEGDDEAVLVEADGRLSLSLFPPRRLLRRSASRKKASSVF